MSLDYEAEEWVPWYIRDSARWLSLSLAARGAQAEIIRKLDKKGRLRLRRLEDLAVLLRVRWEGELEPAMSELLASGRVTYSEDAGLLEDPDFAARSRRAAAAERQRQSRLLRRARDQRSDQEPEEKRGEERRQIVTVTDVTDVTHVTTVTPVTNGHEQEPPLWWPGACDAAETALLGAIKVDDRSARWAEYLASRDRKRWAPGHRDAVGWLTNVLRAERERGRSRGGASRHVQSAENREWTLPKDMP